MEIEDLVKSFRMFKIKKFWQKILKKLKDIDEYYKKHPEDFIEIERISRGFP